ncbi:MAG: SCO family protein [Anaerolineae bacterium]|nr:SCO family protein [Anaerolineae bacterium]
MIFHKRLLQTLLAIITLVIAAGLVVPVSPAGAQEDLPQNLIRQVGFDQNLDAQVPLNLPFTDSEGHDVVLGSYFGQKPVILLLGYYECPMLCSLVRNALFDRLKTFDFTVGDEFELVVISIDPNETPKVAELKRRASIMEYERSTSADGWNFLVGPQDSIKQVADAIGFRYAFDANLDQYVHPSGIVILTPQGKVSRYLYGIEFPEKDLRLGLVEAADNQIGSPIDQLLLTCYHYDPVSGEYTLTIMNIVRVVGSLTVVVIGAALFKMLRDDKNNPITPQSA